MPPESGPLGDDLPGEWEVASYRGNQLTLTDRRVVYRGKLRARQESAMMRLDDIQMVAIMRRRRFKPEWLFLPLGVFVLGILGAFTVSSEGPIIMGMMLALLTIPVPWVGIGGLEFRIAAANEVLSVRIPRTHVHEARRFLQALELARDPKAKAEVTVGLGPTATPFGR